LSYDPSTPHAGSNTSMGTLTPAHNAVG